jgi:hypothetical protein
VLTLGSFGPLNDASNTGLRVVVWSDFWLVGVTGYPNKLFASLYPREMRHHLVLLVIKSLPTLTVPGCATRAAGCGAQCGGAAGAVRHRTSRWKLHDHQASVPMLTLLFHFRASGEVTFTAPYATTSHRRVVELAPPS